MRFENRIISALIVACGCLALFAGSAFAAKSQESVIEDPARLLSVDPAAQAASLDESKALGAEIVKIPILWRTIAPNGDSATKPAGNLSDPNAYPAGAWDVVDRAVTGAQSRGMKVWLMLTAPAPRWAVARESSPGPGAYEPDVDDFKEFAQAVGTRYSSVKIFSIWNENNLARFLQPQQSGGVIKSAIFYRSLYKAGYDGLAAAGQRRSTILFGELLPSWQNLRSGAKPIAWLRTLFCLDTKGKKMTGSAAKKNKCKGIKKLTTSGLAYHPYTQAGGPFVKQTSPDNAPIAYLKRVYKVLDQATKAKRLSSRRTKIYASEFGFQSSPPDPRATTMKKIPAFLNASEYLTWVDSRVTTYSQYLIIDDPDLGGFQSGLRFVDGQKKTGVYEAYQTPIMVFKGRGNTVTVWGGLRAKAPGVAMADIQYKNGSDWTTVKQVPVSSAVGYFKTNVSVSGAQGKTYRVTWSGGTSRETKPGKLIKPFTK